MSRAGSSLAEIARQANVSLMTVSRVLNGYEPKRTAANRQAAKIREISEKLGYRKQSAPLAMRKGKSDTVAILGSASFERNHLPWRRERAIQDVLSAHKQKMMIVREPDEKLTDGAYIPKVMAENCADGILIDYTNDIPERLEGLLKQYQIPAIWMNSKHENDCVYNNDLAAGATLVQHLLELGHTRIAYWSGDVSPEKSPHYSLMERLEGVRHAMHTAGGELLTFCESRAAHRSLPEGLGALLRSQMPPTAIITYSEYEAMAVLSEMSLLGLRLGTDVALTTFCDDVEIVESMNLTAMLTPEKEMGLKAANMLLEKIATPSKNLAAETLSLKLHTGKSTKGMEL